MTSVLTFAQLRSVNAQRSLRWHRSGLDEWSLCDWMVAVAGEAGEALNVVKKLNRARDGQPGNVKSPEALCLDLSDELADGVIYLDILLQAWRPSVLLGGGADSFAEIRRLSISEEMGDRSDMSMWACRMQLQAGQLADCVLNSPPNIGFKVDDLLTELDKLAWCAGIDLGTAVSHKFNATSKAYGFPERLP